MGSYPLLSLAPTYVEVELGCDNTLQVPAAGDQVGKYGENCEIFEFLRVWYCIVCKKAIIVHPWCEGCYGRLGRVKGKDTGIFTLKGTDKISVLERVAGIEMMHPFYRDGSTASGFGFMKNPVGINPFLH